LADYLLQQETGRFTLQEDGGFILLQESVAALYEWVLDTGTVPTLSFVGDYKVGNEYELLVTGEITGARFYRYDAVLPELSHVIELWDAAGVLASTSLASSETAGFSGWIEVDFPTPIPTTSGDHWTVSVELSGHAYSFSVALADAARATFVTARYKVAGPGFPSNTNSANYFVDIRWHEGTTPPISGGGFDYIPIYRPRRR
jgi:Domain of unknown function (DUF4082)